MSTDLLFETKLLDVCTELRDVHQHLSPVTRSVAIFGSARTPPTSPYYELTKNIAQRLSNEGFTVITGGGPGAMEAASHGAFLGASPSIGLNIVLPKEQKPNDYQDVRLFMTHFFTRKFGFNEYAAAYVIAPGGLGTLDELFEVLTLIQTKKITAAPVVLIGSQFWGGLVGWIQDQLLAQSYIHADDLNLWVIADDADAVLAAIKRHPRHAS